MARLVDILFVPNIFDSYYDNSIYQCSAQTIRNRRDVPSNCSVCGRNIRFNTDYTGFAKVGSSFFEADFWREIGYENR